MHIEKILLRDVGPFEDVTIELPKGTNPDLADVYLLTGPNGSGKSTILYALASIIGARPPLDNAAELGHDLLVTRMRSQNALVAFRTDAARTLAVTLPRYLDELRDPFGDEELLGQGAVDATVQLWRSRKSPSTFYAVDAAMFRADAPPELRYPFKWAAFSCTRCNQAKREQWDDALLRPDVPDFAFERYFVYRFDTGELHPNPAATLDEQHRARRTIEILDLNRAGVCTSRKQTVRRLRALAAMEDQDDCAYRYLVPLCRAV